MSPVAARSAAHGLLSVPSDPSRVGHDWLDTLADVPLFEGLAKRHLRRIAKLARIRRFAPGFVMALIDDSPRSADVVAEGEVLALAIDRRGFTKLLRAEPALAEALLRALAARVRAAEATV